jgi:hypothetical protein
LRTESHLGESVVSGDMMIVEVADLCELLFIINVFAIFSLGVKLFTFFEASFGLVVFIFA